MLRIIISLSLLASCSDLQKVEKVSARTSGNIMSDSLDAKGNKKEKTSTSASDKDVEQGIALYDAKCSSCHGGLVDSAVTDKTAEQIRGAISNVAAMNFLSSMSDEEVALVALVLTVPKDEVPGNNDNGGGGPMLTDGKQLYALNCAACHNQIDQSTKKNRPFEAIKAAIENIPQMAGAQTLAEVQVKAIAKALEFPDDGGGDDGGGDPMDDTTRGAMLYANSCEGCHGAVDSSTKRGRNAAAISAAITNVGQMTSLSYLTTDEIDLIASALSAKSSAPAHARARMANRFTMRLRFTQAFYSTNNNAQAFLQRNLGLMITQKISAFGGPCTRYDTACPNSDIAAEANMASPVDPLPNPMRRGYTEGLCRTLLNDNRMVDAVVANAGFNAATAPTRANINRLVRVFRPGMEVPGSVTNALNDVRAAAVQRNFNVRDQWRFLTLPICSSILMEVL